MRAILPDQFRPNQAQRRHLLLRPIKRLNQLTLPNHLQYFPSFHFISLQPLHSIDRQPTSQRLRQQNHISLLRIIGHSKLPLLHDCNCAPSHHRPLIVHSLATAHLRLGLLGGVSEALDHESGRNVLLELVHVGGNAEDH